MGLFGGTPTPYVPPMPTAPPPPPTMADPMVKQAAQNVQRNAAAASGYGSTIATGGQGVTTYSPTDKKQLLGQ